MKLISLLMIFLLSASVVVGSHFTGFAVSSSNDPIVLAEGQNCALRGNGLNIWQSIQPSDYECERAITLKFPDCASVIKYINKYKDNYEAVPDTTQPIKVQLLFNFKVFEENVCNPASTPAKGTCELRVNGVGIWQSTQLGDYECETQINKQFPDCASVINYINEYKDPYESVPDITKAFNVQLIFNTKEFEENVCDPASTPAKGKCSFEVQDSSPSLTWHALWETKAAGSVRECLASRNKRFMEGCLDWLSLIKPTEITVPKDSVAFRLTFNNDVIHKGFCKPSQTSIYSLPYPKTSEELGNCEILFNGQLAWKSPKPITENECERSANDPTNPLYPARRTKSCEEAYDLLGGFKTISIVWNNQQEQLCPPTTTPYPTITPTPKKEPNLYSPVKEPLSPAPTKESSVESRIASLEKRLDEQESLLKKILGWLSGFF